MHDIATFLELETRFWQALVDGDGRTDRALLAADFLGVYGSGFCDRADHVGQLAHGPGIARFALHEARPIEIGEVRVLLAYRADFVRAGQCEI